MVVLVAILVSQGSASSQEILDFTQDDILQTVEQATSSASSTKDFNQSRSQVEIESNYEKDLNNFISKINNQDNGFSVGTIILLILICLVLLGSIWVAIFD